MAWQERGYCAFVAWMGAFFILAVSCPVYATVLKPAKDVVAHFQNTLVMVMKNGERLGFKGRYRLLMPAVRKSHDLPFIAQMTVGPYWGQLSKASREAFVRSFTRLTVTTYAAQFRRYDEEIFRRTAIHAVGRGDVLVETELAAHGHKEAAIDYLLAPVGKGWQIVNIVANGVSDLALKRAQYTTIIRKKGFPALLALLKLKTAQLAKSGARK